MGRGRGEFGGGAGGLGGKYLMFVCFQAVLVIVPLCSPLGGRKVLCRRRPFWLPLGPSALLPCL